MQTRLATGVFSISSLRKPTLEKVPTSLTILRAQVYRDVVFRCPLESSSATRS